MSHFASMCYSSPINTQVLFFDVHDRNFDDRSLNNLCILQIYSFILNPCDSMHDQLNNNAPNLKLKNLYGKARMNWMRKHGTLKFTTAQMNDIFVETC